MVALSSLCFQIVIVQIRKIGKRKNLKRPPSLGSAWTGRP
ncbi:unnamed protein product [Tenebrio molitor]|nr:unnamed protein product [Tenebrio molitor]